MITQFLRFLDKTGFYLLCMCIPGIIFILNGIRIIRTKKTVAIGRDSTFHWKKPAIITGKQAIGDGRCGIIFGLALLLLGIILIIGILQ